MKKQWLILIGSVFVVLYTGIELGVGAGTESLIATLLVLLILWLLRDGSSIPAAPLPDAGAPPVNPKRDDANRQQHGRATTRTAVPQNDVGTEGRGTQAEGAANPMQLLTAGTPPLPCLGHPPEPAASAESPAFNAPTASRKSN
jgi:hypothetical protein